MVKAVQIKQAGGPEKMEYTDIDRQARSREVHPPHRDRPQLHRHLHAPVLPGADAQLHGREGAGVVLEVGPR